jgi:prolyl oligopeptidase
MNTNPSMSGRLKVFAVATALCTMPALAEEADPYLWLEAVDDDKALQWVHKQNKSTADRLTEGPLFETLYSQAREILNSASRLPDVHQEGDWLYNFWRDENNPRGIYRRTTLAGFAADEPAWEAVLDIDALSKKEDTQWVFKGMDCLPPAHHLCLVSLSPGGGDATITREFDAASKKFVADGFNLPLAKGGASWIDADTLFVATDFGPDSMTESGYPRIVKRWRRGTELAAAQVVHEGPAESVSVSAARLRSDAGDLDLVFEGKTFWTSERYLLGEDGKQQLQLPDTATINGLFQGQLIVSLKADWQHQGTTFSRGAVLVIDPAALGSTGKGRLEVLVEPDENTVVQSVTTTRDSILVTVLENVRGRIFRYLAKPEGGFTRSLVDFPDNGALSITSTDDESGSFFVRYQSFTVAPTMYYVASPSWRPQQMKSQPPSFDGSGYRTEQYFARSADGTRVPYFVVMPKDMVFDGSRPTHIFSYGGFRIPLTPSYSGSYENLSGTYGKLWLERGGVFVLANIRGGGEFGPDWHAAALKANRTRAFEDFEAIAEDLVARKITSPGHLGIEGRSNGGLLVGATMTRRPDLYGAVICGVPLLDMKRYHKLLAGASWMAEYGDPDEPSEWAFIREYSPYHNLKQSADYPAVLFYTSTRDDRVHPGHARKMAARMQAMGKETWYYENTEGGHGGSSTNDQLAYRVALAYTHLWNQLR